MYKSKVDGYMRQLTQSVSPPSVISFPTMKEAHKDTHQQDGIHLNAQGIGRLITTYKITVGQILGVPYGAKKGQSKQQHPRLARQSQQYHSVKANPRQSH